MLKNSYFVQFHLVLSSIAIVKILSFINNLSVMFIYKQKKTRITVNKFVLIANIYIYIYII